MFARSLLILSSLAVILEGCYLFCLFRPENAFEEILEQFVEEEMGVDATDDFSQEEDKSSVANDSVEKEF